MVRREFAASPSPETVEARPVREEIDATQLAHAKLSQALRSSERIERSLDLREVE